jgi:hypothetical protein
MAENGKYLIGESLREKLKSTIAKVEALAPGGPDENIPTVHQSMPAYSQRVFRICTFTGAWTINTDHTVTFRGITTTPNTVVATNLFATINAAADSATNRNCAIAKDGATWYLIAAECS